jgi:penicillin amidase
VLLVGAAGGYLYYRGARSLPDVEGTVQLRGLSAPVEALRDGFGIPHLYGADVLDLARAMGYVHAQDRFFQMELARRAGAGRLSELFGTVTLEQDRAARRLGLASAAAAELGRMAPEPRELLDAYVEGVNAYREDHADRLPPEFEILGLRPAPWEATDSLVIGKWLAFFLSQNGRVEMLRHNLAAVVGTEEAYRLTGLTPPESASTEPEAPPSPIEAFDDVRLTSGASNAWAVASDRSASGRPLLASDPHLALSMPSVWYEVHLEGGGLRVAGASIPGLPLVLIGHNERIAWGVTALFADVQDLYLETVNPDNPRQYAVEPPAPGEPAWADFDALTETIPVKDASPVTMEVLVSRHGVVVGKTADGKLVAQRWDAPWSGDHLGALLAMNRAGSWQEFVRALEDWSSPALAFVYADVEGNIGFFPSGSIPVRLAHDGTLPVDGASGAFEWQGPIPHALKPMIFNPEEGTVVSANHAMFPPETPYPLGRDTIAAYRARRIADLLSQTRAATLEDFARIQNDRYDASTEPVLRHAVALHPEDERLASAVAKLRNWSGQMTEGPAPAIYYALYSRLLDNTFRDELGDALFASFLRFLEMGYPGGLQAIVDDDSASYWDDRGTPSVESREDVFAKSLDEAVAVLTTRLGEDIESWDWRTLHGVTFRHPLGVAPPLDLLFNRGPLGFGGSTATVANALVSLTDPFEAPLGTSFRLLVDLGDPGLSRSNLPTGASGHPLSEHYFDQSAGWLSGQSHALAFDRAAVEAAASSKLLLQP